jgi:hypothetical protein
MRKGPRRRLDPNREGITPKTVIPAEAGIQARRVDHGFQLSGLSKNSEHHHFEFSWRIFALENAPHSTIVGSVEVFGVRISRRIELLGIFGKSLSLE